MTCTNCGYDQLDVSHTASMKITYCQQCGGSTEEKDDRPKEPWVHMAKPQTPGRVPEIKSKAINHLIPITNKKNKRH